MEEIPLDDVEPSPDGTFTVTRPGLYTLHGMLIAEVKLHVNGPDVVTLRTARELPKDEPVGLYEGQPEKWQSLNRAQRRAAKRHRN